MAQDKITLAYDFDGKDEKILVNSNSTVKQIKDALQEKHQTEVKMSFIRDLDVERKPTDILSKFLPQVSGWGHSEKAVSIKVEKIIELKYYFIDDKSRMVSRYPLKLPMDTPISQLEEKLTSHMLEGKKYQGKSIKMSFEGYDVESCKKLSQIPKEVLSKLLTLTVISLDQEKRKKQMEEVMRKFTELQTNLKALGDLSAEESLRISDKLEETNKMIGKEVKSSYTPTIFKQS